MIHLRFQRVRHLVMAGGALLLLLGGAWCAVQGGLLPADTPGSLTLVAGKTWGVFALAMGSAPYLASLWLGAAGYGMVLRQLLAPKARHGMVIQLAAGMGTLLMIDWLLAWAGLLNAWSAWGVCALGFFILTYHLPAKVRQIMSQPELWPSPPWTLMLGLPAVGLLLTACACPPGTLWAVESSVYLVQLWHASMALLAAAAVAGIVQRLVGTAAGLIGGIFLHAAPWVIITGSLAYNECFVLAFGGAALLLVFDSVSNTWRGAALVGLLVGWATLAKLPAGFMIAVPIALIMLCRLHRNGHTGDKITLMTAVKSAAIVTLFATLTVAPWLVRNSIWTGNPVFPMATSILGKGHWSDTLAQRWDAVHGSDGIGKGVASLGRQWLWNKGYGAMWGTPQVRTGEAAVFDTAGGVPIIWVGALFGAGLGLGWRAGRRVAGAMLLMIGVQLLFWIIATHHQSRFLVPTLLPGCVLVGLGAGRLDHLLRPRAKPWAIRLMAVAAVLVLTVASFDTFYGQVRPHVDLTQGLVSREPMYAVDSLRPLGDDALFRPAVPGEHVLNVTNGLERVLIVADVSNLLYIQGPTPGIAPGSNLASTPIPSRFVYHTAFDASPLGDLIRQHDGDVNRVTESLLRQGFTHVWIGWAELNRLHNSYGYDDDVTLKRMGELASRWWLIRDYGEPERPFASLYRLSSPPDVR